MRIIVLGLSRDPRVKLLSSALNAPILDPFISDATKIEFDAVVAYVHPPTLLFYYEINNVKIINPVKVIELFGDKFIVYKFFKNKVQTINRKLLLLTSISEEGFEKLKSYWISFFSQFNYPIIIKAARGSLGTTVMKISDLQSAISVIEVLARYSELRTLCVEEFIPHEYDVRVLATWDGKCWMMKRYSNKPDFRTNVAQGGKTEKYYDEELENIALKIMEETGAVFLGMDFIPYENNYVLNEINTKPGFEGIMKTVDNEIPNKLADSIIKWLKK